MVTNKNIDKISNKPVAVLMSTYNGEKYLDKQLSSLNKQSFRNFTVYVRDDSSTDLTVDIIKKWKEKLDIIIIPSLGNIGPAKSFMELVYKCGQHDYYCFCDQDDEWDEDKIEKAVKNLKNKKGPYLYFCNGRFIDEQGNIIKNSTLVDSNNMNFWSEIVCGFFAGCAMAFNFEFMSIIRRGKYRSVPMHDTLFGLTALALGTYTYDKEVHYSRRMHSGNVVGREGKKKIELIKQKIRLWFKDGRSSPVDQFIEDIFYNIKNEKLEIKLDDLIPIINYRKNVVYKIKVLTDKRYTSTNKKAVRSFRVRIILNLI